MIRAFAVFACALAASGCWLAQEDFKNKKNPDFLVIGHRGAPHRAAENTLDAMRAAVDEGANAVEIDVCITRDGELVLWHDRDPDDAVALARQSGLEGFPWVPVPPPSGDPLRRPVDELDLADFSSSHGYARGGTRDPAATVPVLSDFLSWAAAEPALVAVYVDAKVARSEHAVALVDGLDAGFTGPRGRGGVSFFLLSPREDVVVAMRDRAASIDEPAFRAVWDFEREGALSGTELLGLRDASVGLTPLRTEADLLDELGELLEAREDDRLDSITVWTIDRRMQLGVLLYYGVDGIITNEPARLAELWQATL